MRAIPRARLERMLGVLGAPDLAEVRAHLIDWVVRRWIRAHDVEPSVVLGAPALRLGVNTSSPFGRPDLAAEMSRALLYALGVGDADVGSLVEEWVRDHRRELFVAFALEARPRVKLYLRAAPADHALASAGERLVGSPVDLGRAHTLCVDYVDGCPVGAKRYRYCEPDELLSRAPELARFLVAHEIDPALVAAHLSERVGGGGATLHAQVAGFARDDREDLGVAYARAVGASEAPTLARWCAQAPLFTRVLGVALESSARTVYLGMPHVIDELEEP